MSRQLVAKPFPTSPVPVVYGSTMDTYIRDDGRYMNIAITRDMFGLVVLVANGGRHSIRVRSIPIEKIEEGERLMERLGRRRLARGYRRAAS